MTTSSFFLPPGISAMTLKPSWASSWNFTSTSSATRTGTFLSTSLTRRAYDSGARTTTGGDTGASGSPDRTPSAKTVPPLPRLSAANAAKTPSSRRKALRRSRTLRRLTKKSALTSRGIEAVTFSRSSRSAGSRMSGHSSGGSASGSGPWARSPSFASS